MSSSFFNVQLKPAVLQFWVFLALLSYWTIIGLVLHTIVADKIQPINPHTLFWGFIDFLVSMVFTLIYLHPHHIAIFFVYLSQLWNQFLFKYIIKHLTDKTPWVLLPLNMPSGTGQPGRTAIITGGATVVFKELLDDVATPKFLRALLDAGFEKVLIQCGAYKSEVRKKLVGIQHEHLDIELVGFIYNMKEQIKQCRGLVGVRPGGVVFSHAGTGTISDCWEAKVANVIVANPNLMDNHQADFAVEMAKKHETLVLGRLGHLYESVPEAMAVIKSQGLDALYPSQEPALPVPDGVRMGFIDNLFDM